jgi:ribonuclease Z
MFAVTILGNNSAIPSFGRHPTAQVLQTNEENILIDCGEGTQLRLSQYKIKKSKINYIFISHLHGDHYFGLVGLITTMALLGRTADLHIYAPAPLEKIIDIHFEAANTVLPYKIYFHALGNEGEVMNTTKISVTAFKVNHRIECWGFLFKEKKKPKKVLAEQAKAYEIPEAYFGKLQEGEDYVTKKGTIIANKDVTEANVAARSYAFCADTLYDESIAAKITNVDLVYHEATYLAGLEQQAKERYHSTSIQAATIAKMANAKKLIIGHFSSKYDNLDAFLQEATSIFPNTELALEGVCFLA